MIGRINLDSINIILVRPRFHENIGSVARAMKNMGIKRLIVVDGASPLDIRALKLASGAEDILERAMEFETLEEAIHRMRCVVGTTSRLGKERKALLTPKTLAKKLIPISERNPIGIVFGSEREGLTNDELSLCHIYVKIPASDDFPSINLAQAVMVICYEIYQTSNLIKEIPPLLAESEHIEKMLKHMERTLTDIGFLDPKNPKRIMRTLRRLFGRSMLEERDVQILQGIWSKIDWFIRRTIKD